MVSSRSLWGVILCCSAAHTFPSHPALSVVTTVVGTKNLENLAVRHDGNILVTSVSSSSIHQVSPSGAHPPVLVAQIPDLTALTGIVELEQDVFYVAATNLTGFPNSNEIWRLDMRRFRTTTSGAIHQRPVLSLSARVPNARVLNGMTRLTKNDRENILVSDSSDGTVTRVNVHTGEHTVVLKDSTMSSTADGIGVGVNGIRTHGDRLFFVNLDQRLFASVPVSLAAGTATGDVDVIINGTLQAGDDFALSRDGTRAWVAENGVNILREIDILSKTSRIAANCTVLGSITSASLGRTRYDRDSLYITGAVNVNGTNVEGLVIKASNLA